MPEQPVPVPAAAPGAGGGPSPRRPHVHPSILSADFTDLAAEVRRIGTADAVHVDVMDNHFVPNLTLGLPVVERLAAVSALPLDCHLMVEAPDRWAPAYAEAGAQGVTFHAEAAAAPVRLARELRPHLIILDFVLEDMTAFDVLDELKADPRTREIPVIL